MNEFAALFTSKRVEKGLSQDEIAGMLNVTRQAVSKWENGKAMPDISLMPQISELLGVSVDELLTGKEPEKQIVEKVVVQEKEVVKPMPARKILAIVAPIVLVIVLASALMGVYIPKAIAENTPPVIINPEPEPEIEYTEVFIKGKSNSDDNVFQANLIQGKAYYNLKMQLSSDYTLYITAPAGAVATLNGKTIAEFDIAKTVEYTQYFKTKIFEKDEKYNENSLFDEYQLTPSEYEGEYRYALVLDMTNCDVEDCIKTNQKINLKQKIGFEDVIIPAHGTYFVAIPTTVSNKAEAHHYIIKSEGIKFVQTYIIVNDSGRVEIASNQSNFMPEPIEDFYFVDYKDCYKNYKNQVVNSDWQIGFINTTDRDMHLLLEEKPIEEIQLGQEVFIDAKGTRFYKYVFKLHLEKDTMLMYKHSGDMWLGQTEPWYFSDKKKYSNVAWITVPQADINLRVFRYTEIAVADEYYVVLIAHDSESYSIVIDDWNKYVNELYVL